MADDSAAANLPGALIAGLPAGTLHQDETIIMLTKPSILFIFISSFRFVLTVLLFSWLFVSMAPSVSSRSISLIATIVVLGRLMWALLVWTSHIYILTDQRIITIKGVLNVAIFQATLRKIQRTTLYQPLYQRIFGLGTIGFATAAAVSNFDSIWLMVPEPESTHEQVVAAIHRVQ
jgi:uncharacterized membrane protein YdbT with pleckstrin-like domain